MSTPLYFCLRIPEFAAQALVRLRPALAKAAVAVLEGEPPLEKTCALTLQARRLGIRHGMTRTELESVPNLTILRRSALEEQNAALVLLEMAARFTPRIEELPRCAAHTLALDMSGSDRLLGPPHVIGQKLFRAARELGFFSRVVSSRNLHTALCLSRAPGTALIAVPPGEERVFLHDLPLAALDLTDELVDTFTAWGLRTAGDLAALLPADLVARLGQEGLRLHRLATGSHDHLFVPGEPSFTLEEHLALDTPVDNLESLLFVLAPMLDQLISRARNRVLLLASVTIQLHLERSADQTDRDRHGDLPPSSTMAGRPTAGTADRSTSPRSPSTYKSQTRPPRLPHQAHLPPPQKAPKGPAPSAPKAVPGPAKADTTSRAASVTHLAPSPEGTTQCECSTLPIHERVLRPALPLDDRHLLLKLMQLDLQAHPAPAAIAAITLHAEPGPRPGVQAGLFSPQSPEPMRLEVTLARIAALVGSDRVGQAVLTDNHRAESFRLERFTVAQPVRRERHMSRGVANKAETSPIRTGVALRRLRPAPPVDVTYADGRPYTLRLHTPSLPNALTVHRAFGPWRHSGKWWSHEVWSREEWDIDAQATDGTHLLALLTNDRLRQHWQLEALYD